MLTLRQALDLPCFERAQVVACAAGLDQVVRRIHIVDSPAVVSEWSSGGLLLTTGYGLRDSHELQAGLVPMLVSQGMVGVVFAIGHYFAHTPAAICAAAEAAGVVVIEVPPEVQLITIIERLYIEITNAQFALEKRAQDIHRQLTNIALRSGDLGAVAEALARILDRSVLIESADYQVLAASQIGPVDEARRNAMAQGHTNAQLVEAMMQRGIYAMLRQQLRAIRLPPIPAIGFNMARVVAPIIADREVYGYIWIVAGDRPLTELDELAIDNAATVAALMLLKEQAVQETQQSIRGDFLLQLLRGGEHAPALLALAQDLGYRFDQPHQILFIRRRDEGGSQALVGQIERWLRTAGLRGLVIARDHGVALVIEARANTAGQRLAERLVAELSTPYSSLTVGVGGVCAPGQRLGTAYDQALEAADIGMRLRTAGQVCLFWELGMLTWLYRLPPETLAHNPYYAHILLLADYDRRHRQALIETLAAYLTAGGALIEAAAALSIHRNTLIYRIGRIQELLGLDLKQAEHRSNLHIALKAYQLQR